MDLVEQLELEHGPLTEAVAELADLVGDVERGVRPAQQGREALVAAVERLREQVLEHFGREEECFFPFFVRTLPGIKDDVEALEAAHDRLSGSLTRLLHLASSGRPGFSERFEQITRVFRRFESTYAEHARIERLVLRCAADALDAGQREALAEAAKGLL